MKCPNCGIDLRPDDKVCFVCGTPVVNAENEQTRLMTQAENNDHRQNEPVSVQQRAYRQQETDAPVNSYYAAPRNSGIGDGYQNMPNDSFEPNNAPKKKKKGKALVISIIALVLVIAIVVGVIVIVSGNSVSAAELQEAKEQYLPPAEAVAIDTTLDDPSNENIKFKYDDRARIVSCTYSANKKTYDQRYDYNDSLRKVTIETQYKKHPIYTKDIEYDRVTTAGQFEAIDGYYLRLDEDTLNNAGGGRAISSEASTAGENSKTKPTTVERVLNTESEKQETQLQDEPETPTESNNEKESCGDNAFWDLDSNGTLTISGYGEMKHLVEAKDQPWADRRSEIKRVVVEEGITKIACSAFADCENMTTVDLPSTITDIDANAFYRSGLTEIVIPDGVTTIERSAFQECPSLTRVVLPQGLTTIEMHAFWSSTALEEINIPDGVTKIGMWAFEKCSALKEITIPGSVTKIDLEVFREDTSLETVVIEDGVTEIGEQAFYGCTSLRTVTIPASVTSISVSEPAFGGCTSLEALYFGGSEEEWNRIFSQGGNGNWNALVQFNS